MFDAPLQRPIVALADEDIHVPRVLVDQRLPQRREIPRRRVLRFPFFRWQQHERLPGLEPTVRLAGSCTSGPPLSTHMITSSFVAASLRPVMSTFPCGTATACRPQVRWLQITSTPRQTPSRLAGRAAHCAHGQREFLLGRSYCRPEART
jgi:hypothetical protein